MEQESGRVNDGGFGPWIEGLIMAEEHDREMLKPCPFCGSIAKLDIMQNITYFQVHIGFCFNLHLNTGNPLFKH